MASQKVLLPYNFTITDRKALDFVIRTFAPQEGVEITLFNTYTAAPKIDLRASPVMDRVAINLNYIQKQIEEQEANLSAARKELVENGFSEGQIKCVFEPINKDVALDIVDLAVKGKYGTIVLSRTPGRISRFFKGSVFIKVVTSIKDITVIVVT